jgi:NADPH:quinone reductase-like Zn-dependent oxidoreductase
MNQAISSLSSNNTKHGESLKMQAIVQHKYGAPQAVLELQDIAKPVVKDNEALVRVHAASVHVGDWLLVRGVPYVLRMASGLRTPKHRVPGTDIAGTVAAVGKDVTRLRPGDEVFGWCTGAFAEYACATEDHFVPKPAGLTFAQAAAVGVSASTALQLLRDQGKVQPGQKVLINGASGGVGTFAVQIAKALGAEVTGVCSTRNVEMVRSIGADHVIAYTQEDFTQGGQGGQRYDFILDNVANHSLSATRRALTPKGTLCSNGGGHASGRWVGSLGSVIKVAAVSRFVPQQLGPSIKFPNRADLVVLKELIEGGKVTPVIDRTYPLSETAQAIDHVGEGHARGTVVISV